MIPLETEMTTTRKTITVTDQQDEWIKSRIAAGEFTNDSEYIRDLIRRDQKENDGSSGSGHLCYPCL